MSALATLLWGVPVAASFSLLLLLIRSQDRFASVAKSGWARVITGAVLLVLFSLVQFLLHLPVVAMVPGVYSEWISLAAR